MNSVNVNQKAASFFSLQELPKMSDIVSSIVSEASCLAQGIIEYTSDVLHDCGRAVSYGSEWIGDYSRFSPEVKDSAHRVKNAADRFNFFGSFCDTYMAGKALVTKEIENMGDAVDSIGSYVGSSLDFAGKLDEFNIVSLGDLKPYLGGVGGLADASVGLNGIREILQDPDFGKSWISSFLQLAKHVSLVALATLGAVASYFTTFAATVPHMSLYLLTAATTFLAIKVASAFYDKLALPHPLEIGIKA